MSEMPGFSTNSDSKVSEITFFQAKTDICVLRMSEMLGFFTDPDSKVSEIAFFQAKTDIALSRKPRKLIGNYGLK